MIRFLSCAFAAAAILMAGASVVPSASLATLNVQEAFLVQPGDGADDDYACMCEVLGTCHAPMASGGGSSADGDPSSRQGASPFDHRPLVGLMPEVPSPPPRVT